MDESTQAVVSAIISAEEEAQSNRELTAKLIAEQEASTRQLKADAESNLVQRIIDSGFKG